MTRVLLILSAMGLAPGFCQGQHEPQEVLEKILEHFKPIGDFELGLTYSVYKDSLSSTPISSNHTAYWRTQELDVIRSGDHCQIVADTIQLMIDHGLKVIVLAKADRASKVAPFASLNLDSLLSGQEYRILKGSANTKVLQFRYSWKYPFSCVELEYNARNYLPIAARIYSRMPTETSQGEWLSKPKIELNYQIPKTRNDKVDAPEQLSTYLNWGAKNISLKPEFGDYEFVNDLIR